MKSLWAIPLILMATEAVRADQRPSLDVVAWLNGCVAISGEAQGAQGRELDCLSLAERYCRTGRKAEEYAPCIGTLQTSVQSQTADLSTRLADTATPQHLSAIGQKLFEKRLTRTLEEPKEDDLACPPALRPEACALSKIGLRWLELRSLGKKAGIELTGRSE